MLDEFESELGATNQELAICDSPIPIPLRECVDSDELQTHRDLARESSLKIAANSRQSGFGVSAEQSRLTPASRKGSKVSGVPDAVQTLFQSVLDNKDAELTRLEGICVKLRQQCDSNKRFIETLKSRQQSDAQEILKLQSVIEAQSRSLKDLNEASKANMARKQSPINKGCTISQTLPISIESDNTSSIREKYDMSLRLEQVGADLLSATRERDRYKCELDKLKTTPSRSRRASIEPISNLSDEQVTAIDAQWIRKLNTLKTKHEKIVADYQETIKKMAERERSLMRQPAPVAEKPDETKILKKRIQDLEARVDSVKNFYLLKMKKQHNCGMMSMPIVEPQEVRKPQRIVEKLPTVSLKGWYSYSADATLANPPLSDQSTSMTVHEWSDLLRSISTSCDLDVLRRLLAKTEGDEEISEADFRLRVGVCFDSWTIDQICSVYVSEGVADVNLFLSDLRARIAGPAADLEDQVGTLKAHISTLMYELKDKIECIESGNSIISRGLLSPQRRPKTLSETLKHSFALNTIPHIRE